MRLDAEKNVIPDPERVVTQLLDTHAVIDQRLGIRHFGIGRKVARGDTVRVGQDGHFASSSFFSR